MQRNSHILLSFSYKVKHTLWPINPTWDSYPRKPMFTQRHEYIYSSFIYNYSKLKSPKFSSSGEWISRLCFIHRWNTIQQLKATNYWYLHNKDKSKRHYAKWKMPGSKAFFSFIRVSRKDKIIGIINRSVVSRI